MIYGADKNMVNSRLFLVNIIGFETGKERGKEIVDTGRNERKR